jgi:hypothetical protein
MMVPKYTKIAKFFGGIAHLITLRRYVGKWPSFESMDEECVNCRKPPASHGCVKVGCKFLLCGEDIVVKHSTSPFEPYKFEEAGDERPAQPPINTEAACSGERPPNSLVYSQHGNNQDGKQSFKQV